MAKRKAKSSRRAGAAPKRVAAAKRRTAARKATARKPAARTAKSARRMAKVATKKKAARKAAPGRPKVKRVAKKAAPTRKLARLAKRRTAAAKAPAKVSIIRRATTPAPAKPAPVKAVAPRPKVAAPAGGGKKKYALGLDRERRVILDDDVVSAMPPSSLNLDRSASAARSGRQELRERYDKHTETSPALTGGDVDADWESAYSTGDEAPGGDNPTPDQNVVDDIGLAVGNEYKDNEELEGADKIEERDKHRWEFDPASSEDFEDR
jgi:hypothetical protein